MKTNRKALGLLAGYFTLFNIPAVQAAANSDSTDMLNNYNNEISTELDLYKEPVVRAITEVNIRKEPNTDCEILGLLGTGEVLRYTGSLNGWSEVIYKGKMAYVCSDYVALDFDYILPDEFKKMVFIAGDTTVYASSNYDSPISKILTDDSGEVYKETNGFYLVKTDDYIGYVPIDNTFELGDNVVVVDISSQRLSLYYDNQKQLTTDVVTGSPSSPTYLGLYYIYSKERNRRLIGPGYDVPVEVWMPFNGGIGLHDANWRYGVFGGDIYTYNGSHGCVNLSSEAAHKIYDNVYEGTPVFVKK